MRRIFGYSNGHIDFKIMKGKYFLLSFGENKPIARFDTEEKARLFANGLILGFEKGYSQGKNDITNRKGEHHGKSKK